MTNLSINTWRGAPIGIGGDAGRVPTVDDGLGPSTIACEGRVGDKATSSRRPFGLDDAQGSVSHLDTLFSSRRTRALQSFSVFKLFPRNAVAKSAGMAASTRNDRNSLVRSVRDPYRPRGLLP
jgi:hypothetical protein